MLDLISFCVPYIMPETLPGFYKHTFIIFTIILVLKVFATLFVMYGIFVLGNCYRLLMVSSLVDRRQHELVN